MEQQDFDTWDQFEDALARLEDERAEARGVTGPGVSTMLFRGQSNADWHLETSLERRFDRGLYFREFYRLALTAKTQVETLTGQTWAIPQYEAMREWALEYDSIHEALPGYEYLAYLRHHGFPSPLLDWTKSPYVAAFFAFSKAVGDRVAVYAYQEYSGLGKVGGADATQIKSLGPYIRTHSRHYLQQSQYTFACRFYSERGWQFASHEDAFSASPETQDRLWKFTFPREIVPSVLARLDRYNLNAYSLFQTEEALLETIAIREIDFREREL